jgi:alkanesulfonate monooxygenase SsuD/methylene tetrahydromethanopterin reductase-like flavin-dependent oxidoreductase (luciferase family)
MSVSIGFKTPPQHTPWSELLAFWQEADQIHLLEHGWLFDHLNPVDSAAANGPEIVGPCFEGWTALTALAATTRRLRMGLMTASASYRDPATHAQIAAMADVVSGGRIEFGIGAGWTVFEHESRGIPLLPPAPRIRRMEEGIVIARRLWTEEAVDHSGEFFRLQGARLEPKPVQAGGPPVFIGGNGEQLMLRVVARHADVWNFAGGDVATFRHKVAVLHEHCAAVGRDPGTIGLSAQVRVDLADPDAGVRAATAFIEAGATHLILIVQRPFAAGMATRLAEEVVARLR